MTTLDLFADDLYAGLCAPAVEIRSRVSFFDWIIRAHARLRKGRARATSHRRRVHLPECDLACPWPRRERTRSGL